jgi:DNA-binding MarR family transcriptional regulator
MMKTGLDKQAGAEIVRESDVRRFRTLLRALLRRFSVSERADTECCGMTVAQAAALEALGAQGALRLGRLGQLLGIAPSTLTRNFVRLEEGGLVRRSFDAEDARAFRVELTEKGRRAFERLEKMEDGFAERVLSRLPPDARLRALDGLFQLLEAVHAETESCCSGAYDHLMEDAVSCCASPTHETRKTRR